MGLIAFRMCGLYIQQSHITLFIASEVDYKQIQLIVFRRWLSN